MQVPSADALALVADRALSEVQSGMRLGLGTGRAAEAFVRRLGKAVREGLDVVGVPTSERSAALAEQEGVKVVSLADVRALDVAFDGADEVAPDGSLTKGLGGAMLRERIVANEAARFVVLVTPEKMVPRLGSRSPLPIEIVEFALPSALRRLERIGRPAIRRNASGEMYKTDNGHPVIDLHPNDADSGWTDARELDAFVRRIAGVIDTGFFFDIAKLILVGETKVVREVLPPGASQFGMT